MKIKQLMEPTEILVKQTRTSTYIQRFAQVLQKLWDVKPYKKSADLQPEQSNLLHRNNITAD
jgi:hypothetical protein